MRRSTLVAIFAVVVSLLAAVPGWCPPLPGLSPDLYAAPHAFSLPQHTSVRCFAMGGLQTALLDDSFANPAYAGYLTRTSWELTPGVVDWADGPNLNQLVGSVSFPLKPDNPNAGGLQIALSRTTSTSVQVPAFGGLAVRMGETDLGIMYGRPVGRRLRMGLSILPILNASVRVTNPYLGNLPILMTDAHYKVAPGARLGAAYDLSEDLRISALYDQGEQEVNASGMAIGPPVELTYHNKQLCAGLSYQLGDANTLAVEWQHYELKGPASGRTRGSWHFGAEHVFPGNWALRAGSNDGSLTAGLGCRTADGKWRFDYTYLRNWDDKDFGPIFGSSNSHMLMAERYF